MEDPPESYPIKIRSVNSTQFEVFVTSETKVSDLKSMIKLQTQIPEDQQRIIYRGKLLKNPDSIGSYKIERGHVIQLAAGRIAQEPPAPEEEEPRSDTLGDILRLALETNPASLLNRRRRRYHRRREIDTNERLEAIKQNLQTIEGMLQSMNNTTNEGEIQGFDNNRRQFVRGQWLDVKDTVDQWLEAQIIDIQNTPQGTMAYFHYNGWPTRWDEWINISSPRIQPLHAHTLQSIISPMHSPFPVIPTDAENARPSGPYDINEFILQASSLLEQIKSMMERYYSLTTILRHERAGERVGPMRERLSMMENRLEEEKDWSQDPHVTNSEATIGSDVEDSLSMELEGSFESRETEMTTEQELMLLTVQLAPLLDRTGRLLTDLAAIIGGTVQRPPDDAASVSSSLITNESGISNNSARPPLQIPVMPTPSELASINPRVFGPDIDIHIHAIFPQRGQEQEQERTPCWRQLS